MKNHFTAIKERLNKIDRNDVLFLVGLLSIAIGLFVVNLGLGFIGSGLMLVWVACDGARPKGE